MQAQNTNTKRLRDYHQSISEFFPQILAAAQPTSLQSQVFVVQMESNYNKFGGNMFLSASQLSWLFDLATREEVSAHEEATHQGATHEEVA